MTQPTYIVSGFPRSGTSMMMRAVDAGGIRALYSPRRDREVMSFATSGYHPNPGGFFELLDLRRCPWHKAAGRCVKVISGNIPHLLPKGNYRAVYMVRDPDEIKQSHAIAFGTKGRHAFSFLYDYEGQVADDIYMLESKGAEVVAVRFTDLIADPVGQFSRLNWPLNIAAAASAIEPALYRNRRVA